MRDVSIDLESLGTDYDAPVIAIGAVKFNRRTGEVGGTFYQNIDWNSAMKVGRADGNTIKWWMNQSEEAREGLMDNQMVVGNALQKFKEWLPARAKPWGNGATFDVGMLERMYTDIRKLSIPWDFRDVRDMRTLSELAESQSFDWNKVQRKGVHHNAVDDAVHQARLIIAMTKHLGLGK